MNDGDGRTSVEAMLKIVNRAFHEYTVAKEARAKMQIERSSMPSPDGHFAFRQALMRETEATVRYRDALSECIRALRTA